MTKTSNTFNGVSDDPDAPINWELDYCEKCHQMTNHNGNGICLKCIAYNQHPGAGFVQIANSGGGDDK